MHADVPSCLEPLIERSAQHEVLWGADGLPSLRGTLFGYAYRLSFSAEPAGHAAWDEDHRVFIHLVMDFPFGFDVRLRLKPEHSEKKRKKSKKPQERPRTGIVGFDDHFEAKAADADLGRALPWLRDGAFQQALYELCKDRYEVRLGPDALHISGPPRRGSLAEAAEEIRNGTWPAEDAIERLAGAIGKLKSCLKRLGSKSDTGSGVHVVPPVAPTAAPAPPRAPIAPPVLPPTPAPASANAPPEIVFLGDAPGGASTPAAGEVLRIGFDADPAPPPPPSGRRPPHRPGSPRELQPPFHIVGDEERRPLLAWGASWHVERLLQFQALRRRCPALALNLDKDGYPDLSGEIEGFPFVLKVRWSGGKRNMAQATDFTLGLEMKCKPGFESAVYRESWTLRFKNLLGSMEEMKVGKSALDEKYFFTFVSGTKGRFMDLVLDAETEPYLDAVTDLCGVVRFVHDRLETEATEREAPRTKAQFDPFGEGLWPPGHFVERLVVAAHGLAVRVNGLDTGLIFRRMRSY